IPLTR
ncbi:bacterial extracellular solute-binding s, 3 family protein, partial [Escherichia coli 95.0183]